MLKHSAHTFWKFSSSDHGAVLGPLVPDYVGTLQIPNQFGLTQLFPSGRAFLVTPSFAVSQPEHLLAFFELFRKRALVAPCILVACTDFPKYLFDLAMEKAHDSEVFYQRHLSDSKIEDIASEQGLCQKQQEARARAWELIADFSDAKYCGFSSNLEPAEDIRKFVWIDPLIAPDDEQSLLNWYAAWSMTKLDTFRKFYVLGSSAKDNKKANRVLPIPNYLPEVVNDPDNEPDQEGLASIPPQSFEFRSRLFGSDRASDLKPFFDSFQRLVGKSSFWIFFKAISWYVSLGYSSFPMV